MWSDGLYFVYTELFNNLKKFHNFSTNLQNRTLDAFSDIDSNVYVIFTVVNMWTYSKVYRKIFNLTDAFRSTVYPVVVYKGCAYAGIVKGQKCAVSFSYTAHIHCYYTMPELWVFWCYCWNASYKICFYKGVTLSNK